MGGTVTSAPAAAATTIANDFYSIGSTAFADNVVSYSATQGGGPVPWLVCKLQPTLSVFPKYSGIGEPQPNQGVVSLGRGGVLVVQFTNNILTGSNDSRPDLAIYEVGNSEVVRVRSQFPTVPITLRSALHPLTTGIST